MKVGKCDYCGNITAGYVQIKFRKITNGVAGKVKHIDLCDECFKKASKAITDAGSNLSTG